MKLKPLNEQVVVVTGASSGIGRESAIRLGKAGAKVVAVARGEDALASLVREIESAGGEAIHAVCDVSDFEQVQKAADLAEEQFGRIDTWVNNAAILIYGKFWEITPEEFRRVMEVNYLGQIHGSLAALPALRRAGGGALISVSSVESIVSLPLHSAYAASKHAGEGAMDALRRELMADGIPISVTSVKPGVIDTPFFTNARNKLDVMPKAPPPFYDVSSVADCVVYAAEHPVRDLLAGGAVKLQAMIQAVAPGVLDAAMARFAIPASRTDKPATNVAGNFDAPTNDARSRGGLPRPGRRSTYTWLATHPRAKMLAAGAVAAAGVLAFGRRNSGTKCR